MAFTTVIKNKKSVAGKLAQHKKVLAAMIDTWAESPEST